MTVEARPDGCDSGPARPGAVVARVARHTPPTGRAPSTVSRRAFVRSGAAGLVALPRSARVGIAALATLGGCARDAGTAPGFAVLRPRDVPMVRALAPAIVGATGDAAADAAARGVDVLLADSSATVRDAVRPLFDLLAMPVTRGPLFGVWGAWADVTDAKAAAVLDRWAGSRIGMLRAGYDAFASIAAMAWYLDPAHDAAAGYPGPPRKVVEPGAEPVS